MKELSVCELLEIESDILLALGTRRTHRVLKSLSLLLMVMMEMWND
jgi:hypothetical protein